MGGYTVEDHGRFVARQQWRDRREKIAERLRRRITELKARVDKDCVYLRDRAEQDRELETADFEEARDHSAEERETLKDLFEIETCRRKARYDEAINTWSDRDEHTRGLWIRAQRALQNEAKMREADALESSRKGHDSYLHFFQLSRNDRSDMYDRLDREACEEDEILHRGFQDLIARQIRAEKNRWEVRWNRRRERLHEEMERMHGWSKERIEAWNQEQSWIDRGENEEEHQALKMFESFQVEENECYWTVRENRMKVEDIQHKDRWLRFVRDEKILIEERKHQDAEELAWIARVISERDYADWNVERELNIQF